MVFPRGRTQLTPIKPRRRLPQSVDRRGSRSHNAYAMTSRYDAERAEAAGALFDNGATWLATAALVAIVAGYFSRHSLPVYAAALLIAAVALASILASLRFYHPWFSWVGWLVPLALSALVIQPVRVGVISLLTALYAYSLAAVGVFGVLFVARDRLKKWVTTVASP